MDIVYIRDLRIETTIGVYDWEREVRQELVFSLEMGTDISRAAVADDLQHTLDYKAISDRLSDYVGGSSFLLVETVAERCAELLRREFHIPWLRLQVGKPTALVNAADVGVIIERGER